MYNFKVLEPAIDPANRISFLLDWELTMKCNLDCSYCSPGLYGGHDNSTKHPPLVECLKSIDFMFKYVDLYMATKPKGLRYVILNVYGGESLYHPDIETILATLHNKYAEYTDLWNLTVTTTTNAIISTKKLLKILPYIDEFTVSYHTESTPKQKQQFFDNLLLIKQHNKRQKCVVLMHPGPENFADATNMITWLTSNDIKYLPRQLDSSVEDTQFNYQQEQVIWLDNVYQSKTYKSDSTIIDPKIDQNNNVDLADTGRACCGGRTLCKDADYKSRTFFVENKFPDWYCSVNHFFVYIKQVTGEIFTNKDCKMNYAGSVGPIGTIEEAEKLLAETTDQITNNTMPIIQCKKYKCNCGLCAPKAKNLDQYTNIMKKYQKL
jgi:sulfatase maturation enzyme AslB (radical SAM superfamily)